MAAAAGVAGVFAAAAVPALASTDFTAFSPPLTGASDWITNLPSFGIGPIGLIDDGTSFFVTDYTNGVLYKLPASGGDASTATAAADGLFGLALSHGTYFGTNLGPSILTFDPATLAVTATAAVLPCGGLGIAGDPLSTDLYVDTFCGIYRVQNPTSAAPTVTLFSTAVTDEFDGLTISSDGQQFWAADIFGADSPAVLEFNRSGALLQTVPDFSGPDGVGIAKPNTTQGGVNVSNNVFVNNNDGTVWRIDTNNADTVSVVASGGSRGDMATVGPDDCLYVTQSDRVEQITPCFFQPTGSSNAALGPGYWKNHQAQTTALLPQPLGGFSVAAWSEAQAVFNANNCGAKTSQGAVGCLAASLLAAELNEANGAAAVPCVLTAISNANAFLNGLPYTGPTGTYTLSKTDRQNAIGLATSLDNFNNGSLTC